MVVVGKDLKAHFVPPTAMGRDTFHYPSLLPALSNLAWDTSRDGAFLCSESICLWEEQQGKGVKSGTWFPSPHQKQGECRQDSAPPRLILL